MPLTPDPAILKGMELFAGLSDVALGDVLRRSRTRRLPQNTRVFAQGDPALTCHALVHGRIKIVQNTPEGNQVVIRFLGPGEMYGTVAVLMGQPFPADAVAVVDSVEVYWSKEALHELMRHHPDIAVNSNRVVGGRLMDLQGRMRELTGERVERRIARALVRLVREAGRRTEEGIEIDFPITRQEIAEMTGTTLHTVSRTLSGWEDHGIVESSRRHIVVKDPRGLISIAEDLPSPPVR